MKVLKRWIFFLLCFISGYVQLFAFPEYSMTLYGSSALKPTGIMRSVGSFSMNYLKGDVGEYLTNRTYMDRLGPTGWQMETPRSVRQGLDHLFFKFDEDDLLRDILVLESKYRKGPIESSLGQTKSGLQMSESWTSNGIRQSSLSMLDDLLSMEKKGSIVFTSIRPDENLVATQVSLGNDSFYYTLKNDEVQYVYSSKEAYISSDSRIKQVERLMGQIEQYADKNVYRRVVVDYKYDADANVIIQTPYSVRTVDGVDEYIVNSKDIRRFSGESMSKILDSDDFKSYLQNTFGLEDFDFYESMNVGNKLKMMNNNLDADCMSLVFSSYENRAALNRKLGISLDTDLTTVGLTSSEWKKMISAADLSDLDDNLIQKVKKAERSADVRSVARGAGVAAVSSVVTDLIIQKVIQQKDWNELNMGELAFAGGIAATSSIIQSGATIAVRKASTSVMSKTVKTLEKLSDYTPFFVDAILDIGLDSYFAYQGYLNGFYTQRQAWLNLGLNMAIDVASTVTSLVVSSAVSGALAGTTIGGPVGTGVGIALGVTISLGSFYVVDPIMNEIKVFDIFSDLSADNAHDIIKDWTEQYLAEAL